MVDVPSRAEFDSLAARVEALGQPSNSVLRVPQDATEQWFLDRGRQTFEFSGTYPRLRVPATPGSRYLAADGGALFNGDGMEVDSVFYGDFTNCELEGISVANYMMREHASQPGASQKAAFDLSQGANVIARDLTVSDIGRGVGIRLGLSAQLINPTVRDCGSLGINGYQAHHARVIGGMVSDNGKHEHTGWEIGGAKFMECDGLVVDGTQFDRNVGGVWIDGRCKDVVLRDVKGDANTTNPFIHVEVSEDVRIINPQGGNGTQHENKDRPWGNKAQIRLSNARRVSIEGGDLTFPERSNGIGVTQQERADYSDFPLAEGINIIGTRIMRLVGKGEHLVVVTDIPERGLAAVTESVVRA